MPMTGSLLALGSAFIAVSHLFATTVPNSAPDSLDPARGFVFTRNAAATLADSFLRREDFGATWDPTAAEIAELEKILERELYAQIGPGARTTHEKPRVRDYFRQYAGIHLKGHRVILINGFHKSHVERTTEWLAEPRSESQLASFPTKARGANYWHYVPVHVNDGGEHYFLAFYDPTGKRMAGFHFNGVA